jgi:hypothetical protein
MRAFILSPIRGKGRVRGRGRGEGERVRVPHEQGVVE